MAQERPQQRGTPARTAALGRTRPERLRAILGWPDLRHLPGAIAYRASVALAREVDERRGFLWLPVAVGTGVALYFAADREPSLPVAVALAAALVALAWVTRARSGAFHVLAGLAAIAAGFALATAHTASIHHPVLARTLVAAEMSGFVLRAEQRAEGSRIVLHLTALAPSGRARVPEAPPERVRVSLRSPAPAVGEHIALRATVGPPPGPARPGGYDFGRDAWFEGIGATGYALGPPRTSPATEAPPPWLAAAAWLERLRAAIATRITTVLTGDTGAIAAALVTGLRGGISEGAEEAMRISGLSHILSISGLHMALVVATAFFLARALLALSSTLALTRPIKAWAALPALLAATFYLVLSGNEVPTQRSYVMAMLVLVGVMLGRPALTLRTLALAALIVLICAPATLLDPGTQMSFAATLALVAAHERYGRRLGIGGSGRDWTGYLLRALLALAFTSLIAGLATAPYAAFHFQRAAPYGLLANVCAIPLVSLVVMPAGLVGALLLPLGLDGLAWLAMGWGIEGMLAIADRVAALPGADRGIPAFPLAALLLLSLAIVSACLLRTRLALAAPALVGGALLLAWETPRPAMLVDAAGRTVAVRGPDGRLALMGDRPPDVLETRFAAEQWRLADGEVASTLNATLQAPTRAVASPSSLPEPPASEPPTARRAEAKRAEPRSPGSVDIQRVPAVPDERGAPAVRTEPARGREDAVPGNRSGGAADPCDRLGCVRPLPDGRLVALSRSADSLVDDCRLAAVLVTSFGAPLECAALVVRVDPYGERTSAVALYEDPEEGQGALRVVSARPAGVERPWLPVPAARPRSPVTSSALDPGRSADTHALPPAGRHPAPRHLDGTRGEGAEARPDERPTANGPIDSRQVGEPPVGDRQGGDDLNGDMSEEPETRVGLPP